MREYWSSLTEREQKLVGTAGVLLSVTILYFLLVLPLVSYQSESERSYEAALSSYQSIQTYAAQLSAANEDGRSQASGGTASVSLRVAISTAARANDVSISRLQPSEDGTLTIWAEGVSSPQLFRWLETLSNSRGIGPTNVLVQKSTAGETLRVQLRFEETS